MHEATPVFLPSVQQLGLALSRWDNEGGAGPDGPQKSDPLPTGVKISQLPVRELHGVTGK